MNRGHYATIKFDPQFVDLKSIVAEGHRFTSIASEYCTKEGKRFILNI